MGDFEDMLEYCDNGCAEPTHQKIIKGLLIISVALTVLTILEVAERYST